MKNIIIDCDPGHDDALAILTAIANSNKLNILGITTIGGNQTLEKLLPMQKHIGICKFYYSVSNGTSQNH